MEHATFSVGNEGRQVFWNAEYFEPVLFLFTAIALAIMAYGFYRRWRMWKALGKPETEDRFANRNERLKYLFRNAILQMNTFKEPYPGVMHGLIFFGFFVLIWGAAFDATQFHITEPLGWAFLRITFSLLLSLIM